MKIETSNFGIIEISEEEVITFPEGLPGFENVRKFVIWGKVEENFPFQWLQSVDKPELAFVIIEPNKLKPDYIVDVADNEIDVLKIEDPQNVSVYSIVVVPEDINKMTANFKAPLLINNCNRMGKQVVMENGQYPIKFYIMDLLNNVGG